MQIKKVKDWLETQDLGRGVTVGYDGFDKYNKEAADYLRREKVRTKVKNN